MLLLLPGTIEDVDIDDDDECDTPPLPCLHGAASPDEGVDMIGLSCFSCVDRFQSFRRVKSDPTCIAKQTGHCKIAERCRQAT